MNESAILAVFVQLRLKKENKSSYRNLVFGLNWQCYGALSATRAPQNEAQEVAQAQASEIDYHWTNEKTKW